MLPFEDPRHATESLVRVFPGVWKLSFLRLPSWDGSPSLPLLSLSLSFIFFPTSFRRQWVAFLGAWCPLPALEVVLWNLLSVQMFFRWICGGESGLPILFLHHLRTAPYLFILFMISFGVQKLISLISLKKNFCFYLLPWGTDIRKHHYDLCWKCFTYVLF